MSHDQSLVITLMESSVFGSKILFWSAQSKRPIILAGVGTLDLSMLQWLDFVFHICEVAPLVDNHIPVPYPNEAHRHQPPQRR